MRRVGITLLFAALSLAALAPTPAASAAGKTRLYEVTIRNLTGGQPLTPPAVATHIEGFHMFRVGTEASFATKEIAENGNLAPMLDLLARSGKVFRSLATDTGPLVPAGRPGAETFDDEVTFRIAATREANRLSFESMLICTNDGFTGVDGLRLPAKIGVTRTRALASYDAGTEINTEDFADIVPPCQSLIGVSSGEPGTGESNPALAEGGVIGMHPGIAGIADLVPSIHGWTDPVAEITVERIR